MMVTEKKDFFLSSTFGQTHHKISSTDALAVVPPVLLVMAAGKAKEPHGLNGEGRGLESDHACHPDHLCIPQKCKLEEMQTMLAGKFPRAFRKPLDLTAS